MAEKREGMIDQEAEARIERSEQLAREAIAYWQTALRGLFALPNATALTVSSAVLYGTGMAERAYKRLELVTGRVGDEIGRSLADSRRPTPLPEPERSKRQPSA